VGAIVTFKKPTPRKQAVNAASPSRKHLNRFRMTEARVDAAPPPASGSAYYYDLDVPGLALRVTAKGVRTFVLVKKISGVTQRITLGRWPGLKLADARRAAARINGEIAAGLDPVALRRAARARAETCSDLWPLYLANIKRKNRSWERDEHRWKAEVAPRIGRKPLSSITPAECQKIVDAVGADHPIKANRIAALLGAFFAFAVKNDRVVRNPARGLSRYEEAARDRFLSGDELRAFLNACTAAPEPWGDFFALLLWTGARKGTVMAMRWSDIDLQNHVWRIPATSAKNKQAAAIALVEPALSILTRRQALHANSPWVFPSSSKSGHLTHAAKAWSAVVKSTGISNLRPHDLRRTVGSWLAASGASSFVIQKALTHKSAASAKAYAHLDVEVVRAAMSEVTILMQGSVDELTSDQNN
jgi:integrase